jgi:cell wall-associated NlpC family hydrolase
MYFKNLFHPLFCALGLLIFISSCSPSNHNRRSSKYSSADKRERTNYSKSEEKKKYTYKTSKEDGYEFKKTGDITRDEIVLNALKYTGRTYASGGKTPETGFDCSGFTSYVFNQTGLPLSGSSDQQAKLGKQKSKSNLLPGDLVFFGHDDRISHVGIVASHKDKEIEVVHSTTSAGVKIDNITQSEYWNSRFMFGVDLISR